LQGTENILKRADDIAHEWVDKNGYGNKSFLIVFHQGILANNHCTYVLSSRIDKEGKKISDSFEKLRSAGSINEIMRRIPKHEVLKL